MKTIAKYFSALGVCVLALGGFTSCDNEDFLTVNEYSKLPVDYMYQSDAEAKMGLNSIYKLMVPYDATDGDWGFKPNLFTGCHPTLDTQATGWDKDWLQQNWSSQTKELLQGWTHCYTAISRANQFLAGLETADKVSEGAKKVYEGEAKALRGFFYHWLATTFRRVPTLGADETTAPEKARAATDEEMWMFIINDMKEAAELLDWKPADGQYGRATKGMALTYLADGYMWLAYRYPEKQREYIEQAKNALEQVKGSGTYELVPSFTTLWDVANPWNKETIWAEILDNKDDGKNTWNDGAARMFTKFYCACPANGGWGSLFLSWEWWASYEKGDKRREGSACTGPVENIREEFKSETNYGINPYLNEPLPANGISDANKSITQYHNMLTGEPGPSIWTTKLWRNASANTDAWGQTVHQPNTIYWKRYANVLIDLAECYFILGDESKGWDLLDQIRARANGKLEAGREAELEATFAPAIIALTQHYNTKDPNYLVLDKYPVPFGPAATELPSAQAYYTALKASGPTWFEDGTAIPFESPAWKVAVNMERRKEFNTEWCLRPDMHRSGFMEEHIKVNYPKHTFPGGDNSNSPWFDRQFEYNPAKMDMPIPADELIKNPACDQNEAYKGE